MGILSRFILSVALVVSPLIVSSAGAGKCGAFFVYDSGPYYPEVYPHLPQRDYRVWTWDASSPEAAREAVKKRCLEKWKEDEPRLAPHPEQDRGLWICGMQSTYFCTDKADLEGWGVGAESYNPCGALAIGDDYITWSPYRTKTYAYLVGMGPSKREAEQAALQKCRTRPQNPLENCRILPGASVCNSR
jgi:hypothetical protein